MYYCVSCARSIETGLICQSCADRAATTGQSRIDVLHCNFCGGTMHGRLGTECHQCETTRLLQEARQSGSSRKQQQQQKSEQPTLWQ